MKQEIRKAINHKYAFIHRLAKEFSDPRRTATEVEITGAIADLHNEIQALLREDLEAHGLVFNPEGPRLDECEHCGGAIQYVPDHKCWGTRAESAELERNDDYKEDIALEPYGDENDPPII